MRFYFSSTSKLFFAMLLLLSMAFLSANFIVVESVDAQGANIDLCIDRNNGQLNKPSIDGACPTGYEKISGIPMTYNGVCVGKEGGRYVARLPEVEFQLSANGRECMEVNGTAVYPFVRFSAIPVYNPNSTPTPTPTSGSGPTPTPKGGGNTPTPTAVNQVRGDCEAKFHKVGPLCVPDSPFTNPDAPINSPSASALAVRIIKIMLYFAGIIAVFMAIIGGYHIMTAGGNETQATNGRKTLTNAIIGLVLVVLSYVIIQAVINFVTK